MKRNEIQKCCLCNQGVMHSRQITFTKLMIERFVVNLGAVQRQHGLEMMLGGAAFIAQTMGPDEDLAEGTGPKTLLVCDQCGINRSVPVLQLNEIAGENLA